VTFFEEPATTPLQGNEARSMILFTFLSIWKLLMQMWWVVEGEQSQIENNYRVIKMTMLSRPKEEMFLC